MCRVAVRLLPLLLGLSCGLAQGMTYTYTYTGHSFQVSGSPAWTGAVTLSFSDTSPLSNGSFQTFLSPPYGPHTWTISDGKNTLSSTDQQATFAGSLTTDSSGN